jgi:hypothetical protein
MADLAALALAAQRPPKPAEILTGWFAGGEPDERVLFLVAEAEGAPVGFLLAVTCGCKAVIADFALSTADPEVGEQLLAEARLRLATRGVFQVRALLPDA